MTNCDMEAKNLIKVGDIMFQRPPAHEDGQAFRRQQGDVLLCAGKRLKYDKILTCLTLADSTRPAVDG